MTEEAFKGLLQGIDETRRWARGEDVPALRVLPMPVEDAQTAAFPSREFEAAGRW